MKDHDYSRPYDSTSDTPFAKVQYASYSVTVKAKPDEVKQVSRDWAKDLGWLDVTGDGSPPCFQSKRYGLRSGGVQLEVDVHEHGDANDVSFVATALNTLILNSDDLALAAEYFADGVCSELRRRGREVTPSYARPPLQKRSRIVAVERWRSRLITVGLIGLLPCAAVTWLATGSGWLGFLVGMWIFYLVAVAVDVMRRRMLGMRAKAIVVMYSLLGALWVILTPVLILGALGVLTPK